VSGLTIYAKNLSEQLSSRGYDVTVLTSQHQKSLPTQEIKDKIKIIRIPVTFRFSKGPLMITFPLKCLQPINESDVVNCHLPSFECFIVAVFSKLLKKKLIVTYHSGISWSGGGLLYKVAKTAVLFSELITLLLADKIVVNTSDYSKSSLLIKMFYKKVSEVFPPIQISAPNERFKKELQKKIGTNNHIKIGMTGRISTEKGVEFLLDTIPLLKEKIGSDFVIALVGPKKPIGEDGYSKKIEKKLLEYQENIVLLGPLPYEQLGSYYAMLDVLVLPSVNSTESFGMVQVEAMLSGTPVIASDLPGVRIPIHITKMGELAKPRSPMSLAENIFKIVRYKKKYERDKRYIENIFSISKTIDRYEELFHNDTIDKK
jgi:glycosyltransferase involved in cell wall biosynthesis